MKTTLTTIIGLLAFATFAAELDLTQWTVPKSLELLRIETKTNVVSRGGPPQRDKDGKVLRDSQNRPVRGGATTNIVRQAVYGTRMQGKETVVVTVPVKK